MFKYINTNNSGNARREQKITEDLIKLAESGDSNTLAALFETVRMDLKSYTYIFELLKAAFTRGHTTTRFMMGMI